MATPRRLVNSLREYNANAKVEADKRRGLVPELSPADRARAEAIAKAKAEYEEHKRQALKQLREYNARVRARASRRAKKVENPEASKRKHPFEEEARSLGVRPEAIVKWLKRCDPAFKIGTDRLTAQHLNAIAKGWYCSGHRPF